VRIESVIAVDATQTVGPTRLRLLTARSSRLPVVVVDGAGDDAVYHVFDVAGLQAAMGTQLSATVLDEALELADRSARQPVSKSDAASAPAGSPVVEGGRLIGVVADDLPEQKEFTEADMARGEPTSGAKRGLWKRITGSGD
jgi:CBS domain-containing protein